MIQPNCTLLHSISVVGPNEVFFSIGHWVTAVYFILALHVIPVWLIGSLLLHRLAKFSPLAWLISVPQLLMFLTSVGILLPSLGKYVEVLIEIVLCMGLIKFLQFSQALCGGKDGLVRCCADRDILLPLGSPPMVCLLPLKKPPVTKYSLSCIMLGPAVLLGIKVVILVVDISYFMMDYEPSGNFLAVDNIHNLASFPIGLGAIYCLNIYLFIINDCLPGNSKRFLGLVLLVEFILFDCQRLFFIFLTGTGMLTCVPPFLSQDMVVHFLKNVIKAFLATFLGVPYLKICAEQNDLPQISEAVVYKKDTNVGETEGADHEAAVTKQELEQLGQLGQHEQAVYEDSCVLGMQRSI